MGQIKYHYADQCDKLTNYFEPIKLDRFTISLTNDQGLSYITDGLDHSIMFEVTQLGRTWTNQTHESKKKAKKTKEAVLDTLEVPVRPATDLPRDNSVNKGVVAAVALLGVGGAAYYLLGKNAKEDD